MTTDASSQQDPRLEELRLFCDSHFYEGWEYEHPSEKEVIAYALRTDPAFMRRVGRQVSLILALEAHRAPDFLAALRSSFPGATGAEGRAFLEELREQIRSELGPKRGLASLAA